VETWLLMELMDLGPLSKMVHSRKMRGAGGRPLMVGARD
jgi:hypothetical protein